EPAAAGRAGTDGRRARGTGAGAPAPRDRTTGRRGHHRRPATGTDGTDHQLTFFAEDSTIPRLLGIIGRVCVLSQDGWSSRDRHRTEDERIREQLRAHGVTLGKGDVAPRVFWPALAIVVGVALFSIIWSDTAGTLWNSIQSGIVSGFGWFYTLAIGSFVIFTL